MNSVKANSGCADPATDLLKSIGEWLSFGGSPHRMSPLVATSMLERGVVDSLNDAHVAVLAYACKEEK
jgi:hypothetical protein